MEPYRSATQLAIDPHKAFLVGMARFALGIGPTCQCLKKASFGLLLPLANGRSFGLCGVKPSRVPEIVWPSPDASSSLASWLGACVALPGAGATMVATAHDEKAWRGIR